MSLTLEHPAIKRSELLRWAGLLEETVKDLRKMAGVGNTLTTDL